MLNWLTLISFYFCCYWRYPALRVGYIEEKEVMVGSAHHPVYSSVLIKAENNLDQVISS